MSAAQNMVRTRRKKCAYHMTLLRAFRLHGSLPEQDAIKAIALVRRKGRIDALDVLLSCIDYGFCSMKGQCIVMNEVTDQMLAS